MPEMNKITHVPPLKYVFRFFGFIAVFLEGGSEYQIMSDRLSELALRGPVTAIGTYGGGPAG